MKTSLRQLLLLMVILTNQAIAYDLKPGESFPDLKLPSIRDGKETSISSLTHKKLMLHLYASW